MKPVSYKLLLLILLSCFLFSSRVSAQNFVVGTYNIRYANTGDSVNGNGWAQRYPVIVSLIRFHNMEIFGVQEGLHHQLETLQQNLPGYAYTGVGRDDGEQKGEYAAIFYDTNKFDLLEKGNFWLSPITDRPNKGWDAALPRICSWGKFREKKTGFVFYFYNLHMDHIGVQARAESAKLVMQKMRELPANMPLILTGDFNVDQFNESYNLINHSGLLRDAYELAPIRLATNGTFNNFNADAQTDSRIDHIFVNQYFQVKRYGILTDTYRGKRTEKELISNKAPYIARVPSDHFPVVVELSYQKK
ncbi:MAG: endonuclease/exonuclease/phosphatase family protein [Bacteroidetes bacterium]|nr:endonuclease/exonuclease/phosphatase family protein [Bacteroidota bacterium]